jgi:hypothetical protein
MAAETILFGDVLSNLCTPSSYSYPCVCCVANVICVGDVVGLFEHAFATMCVSVKTKVTHYSSPISIYTHIGIYIYVWCQGPPTATNTIMCDASPQLV